MRLGLYDLGLRPDEFWNLTPAEFAIMAGEGKAAPALDRSGLEALMQKFPDEKANLNV